MLVIVTVLSFPTIFILLFLVFHFSNQKAQLHQQVADKENIIVTLRNEKRKLEHQISNQQSESSVSMMPFHNKVACQFAKIAKEIEKESPRLTAKFYLKTIGDIMNCFTENVRSKTEKFKQLLRQIRGHAQDLYDDLVDKEQSRENTGDEPDGVVPIEYTSQHVQVDDDAGSEDGFTSMMTEAISEYRRCFNRMCEKLDQLEGEELNKKDCVSHEQ